ncbi:MAG TPA: lasso peptide [Tepidiformaceae bacterium]|nr:lasso peptide [Tepidiformaceae bacterium]
MKKTYETPRLSTHGDIRAMTQGQTAFEFTEGLFQKKPDPTS